MRGKIINFVGMLGMFFFTSLFSAKTVQAQETFTAKGPVSYSVIYDNSTGYLQYNLGGNFEATVTYNSASPRTHYSVIDVPSTTNYNATWDNSVPSIAYTVYDSGGSLVKSGIVNSNNANYEQSRSETLNLLYDSKYENIQDISQEFWMIENQQHDPTGDREFAIAMWVDRSFSDLGYRATEIANYPDPLNNSAWNAEKVVLVSLQAAIGPSFEMSATIQETTGSNQDSDGDGIIDDLDACINSDTSLTVIMGVHDSGVNNTLLSNGCTITDMINRIRTDEDKHGKGISLVSIFLNKIRDEGIISTYERGAIQKVVARDRSIKK